MLVGPDNGLLIPAAEASGGVTAAVELEAGRVASWPVSDTFHGRDLFAPAAARLASGADLDEVGRPIEPQSLTELATERPHVERGRISTTVIGVDRFGNVRLGVRSDDLDAARLSAAELTLLSGGAQVTVRRIRTFGELAPPTVGLLVDSAGWIAAVQNGASAAEELGLRPGDAVELRAPGVG
jgi:S-adenosyl-L-methionine hydrolase (adenosine-forming)